MHNEWYTFKSIISLLTNYNWYNRSWSKYNYALNWSYWYLPMACASPALSFSLKFFWSKEITTVLSSSSFSSVQVNNFQKVYFSPFFRPCAILERFWVAYQRDPKIMQPTSEWGNASSEKSLEARQSRKLSRQDSYGVTSNKLW